ncbi:hypothetical protein FF011L_30040 [Roseimaritima multifibrata]|uniref:4-O-methyl-glucuronoyl methylesterase-like domain-containing protein n=1 Tax=Roseimaritima multifibrata TaxID=1930274 RepID=A0A517MH68_9BACT|nr:acetylxylan esterase [Roseimaritima multifibrata]QDS94225.1 hypothetical protein FF011L_30040 [Roseimaritima multifibrata]
MSARIIFIVLVVSWISQRAMLVPLRAEEPNWEPRPFDKLPIVETLPDLLNFEDGKPVVTKQDWLRRRKELQAILEYYAYGHSPPRPATIHSETTRISTLPDSTISEELITLSVAEHKAVRFRIAVYRPDTDKPLPVIVREEHALGHTEEVPLVVGREFMFVEFAREDLAPDEANVVGPAQAAYPEYDWATLAVWAWGAMRVVDYLESRDDVDLTRIGIVGHSRGGKMSLLAGALDQRFSLVAANGSGAGGAGSFRIQGKRVETLELITRPDRFGYWFHPRLRQFAGHESRLPFDQHFLKALVAPRALICTDAIDDQWANPEGNRITSKAAQPAFELLGAKDHNSLRFRPGNHDLLAEDWNSILDFAQWHWYGNRPSDIKPYFDYR